MSASPCLRPAVLALLALLATAPALAQVTVKVTAPADVLIAGETLPCTATVTGTANHAVTWSVTRDHVPVADAMPKPGLFLAPGGAPSALYRIRAASVEDPGAFDEWTVAVTGVGAGVHGVVPTGVADVARGYLGHPNPSLQGLPFLDTETGERYGPKADVEPLGPVSLPGGGQVFGYGLAVPFGFDHPKLNLATASGLWLSFREGGDMVRYNPTGKDHVVLKLTGWVRDGTLEALRHKPGKPGTWTSQVCKTSFQVRGVVPFAGRSVYGPAWDAGDDDGQGQGARFHRPLGMAKLGYRGGEVTALVADPDRHVLRSLSATAKAGTFCGKAGEAGFSDGLGAAARFDSPSFLASQPLMGDPVLVSDSGNHAIRQVALDGTVTTLAGNGQPGFQNGPGKAAQFKDPQGLALDLDGNVYVADAGNFRIRKITPAGVVSSFAGSGAKGCADGPAAEATFTALRGLVYDTEYPGRLFVVDGNAIRRISMEGKVTTVVGQVDTPGFILEGTFDGSPLPPALNRPCGLAITWNMVLVADEGNHALRVLGVPSTDGNTYHLSTLVGDAGWPDTHWGRFRDRLPWADPETFAALGSPRGVLPLDLNRVLVANGNGVAMLANPFPAFFPRRGRNGTHCELSAKPGELRAGAAFTLGIQVRDVAHNEGVDSQVVRFHWKLTLVDPGTGEEVVDPATGKKVGAQEGRCRAGQHVSAPILLPTAGSVEARLTVVTDEGVTVFDSKTLTIHPQ